MPDTMFQARAVGKTNLQLFQKAILMSIKSLKLLFLDLKSEFKIEYIATHKVNQDALENLFGQLRSRGGLNDHPTPLDVLNRLRLIILGRNSMSPSKMNTTDRVQDEEYLVGKLIKTLQPRNKNKNAVQPLILTANENVPLNLHCDLEEDGDLFNANGNYNY